MSAPPDKPDPNFLRRWSQRKLAAARESAATPPASPPVPPSTAAAVPPVAAAPATPTAPAEAKLPDVATLSFDSDFRPFLAPDVDEGTRRAALRKLFADPHFNTMDGLDVYIDDYNKFEPMTPEIVKQLAHARYLFDPPQTRVNAEGHVEDVVDEPRKVAGSAEVAADDAPSASGTITAAGASEAQERDTGAANAPSSIPAPAMPDAPKTTR